MSILVHAYRIDVVLEIHPVVREGPIPWNLMTPIFGLFFGFVIFFVNESSPMQALSVWILQVVSVTLEFVIYRHYGILLEELEQRLEVVDKQLLAHKKGYQQKSKLPRPRREIQSRHIRIRTRLQKYSIGVFINIFSVLVTLLLIVYVARKVGMCVKDGNRTLFSLEPKMECDLCEGGRCQVCDWELGDAECYFPFFY